MYKGRIVFTQLMDHLPRHTFRRCVRRYGGERWGRTFTCWNQFLALAFAQLTYRESLRDIEACLGAAGDKLYHMGFRSPVSRSTLHPRPGYIDSARLHRLSEAKATFVVRAKKNLKFRRIYSHPVDRTTGLICDQTIGLAHLTSLEAYPGKLRRVRFKDPESGRAIVLLTNDFTLPPLTVAELYRLRWQVEFFFK